MECFFAFAAELAGRGNRSLAADLYIYIYIDSGYSSSYVSLGVSVAICKWVRFCFFCWDLLQVKVELLFFGNKFHFY